MLNSHLLLMRLWCLMNSWEMRFNHKNIFLWLIFSPLGGRRAAAQFSAIARRNYNRVCDEGSPSHWESAADETEAFRKSTPNFPWKAQCGNSYKVKEEGNLKYSEDSWNIIMIDTLMYVLCVLFVEATSTVELTWLISTTQFTHVYQME